MNKISIIAILFSFVSDLALAAEVNIFNARDYKADAELYGKCTESNGIKINLIRSKKLIT